MGIYIKGMKMPDRCYACPLCCFDGDGGVMCGISHGSYVEYIDVDENIAIDHRPDDCPLIEVPPHGRLIDVDAFERLECNGCDGACEALPCDCTNCDAECRCYFMLDIHAAPTVIPAEYGIKNEDSEHWKCLSCRHYPPSSTDGKPCSQCDTSDVWHNCYDPAESEDIQ